jgi:hypothetical protein
VLGLGALLLCVGSCVASHGPRASLPDAAEHDDQGDEGEDPDADSMTFTDDADAGWQVPDEEELDAAAPPSRVPDEDSGRASVDSSLAGDEGVSRSCVAADKALETVVADCFTLNDRPTLCVHLRIGDKQAIGLSTMSSSATRDRDRMSILCAYKALQNLCLESDAGEIEACYPAL